MIKCAIYPRKSKQVDNSDSIDAQIDMCKRYLDEHYGPGNYTVKIYDGDYGITGHSIKNRKDFQRMMKDVAERRIQLVLIQRYDRIARNTRDFCNIYYEMEKNGCNLVSVSQQIDTSTPYGRNFMYMQASMAELEWALSSERRKDANKYARSIGKCTLPDHSIPFGYKAEKIDGVRRMVKDRENEEIVLDIFRHFNDYGNYCAAAKYINDKYSLQFTNNRIKNIIKNKSYYGEYGENQSFCEPYITRSQWEKLQEKKAVIRSDPRKKTEILFSGMIRCPECGRLMRSCQKKHRSGKIYRHFHCEYHASGSCSFRRVKSELKLEKMLIDYINNNVVAVMAEGKAEKSNKPPSKKRDYIREIERLNIMYQKGRITEDYYESEYSRISSLIEEEDRRKKQIQGGKKLKEIFFVEWEKAYMDLDKLNKKLFWRDIVSRIVVDNDMNIVDVVFL